MGAREPSEGIGNMLKYRDKNDHIELPEIPEEIYQIFDKLYKHLNSTNQRTLLKLRKIYDFMDLYSNFVSTFAVCKKGCSHCCSIDVSVAEIEAIYIEENSSIKIKRPLKRQTRGNKSKCPFLVENECSIYGIRPFQCRTFFTLDNPKYCSSGEEHKIYGSFNGGYTVDFYEKLDKILRELNTKKSILDIRDYFG